MRRKKLGQSTPRSVQHSFVKAAGSISARGLCICIFISLATKDTRKHITYPNYLLF